MKADRLLRLADLLEKDANNPTGMTFQLRSWISRTPTSFIVDEAFDEAFEEAAKKKAVPVECGTSGCAMGLAALSGEFKDEGLSYKPIEADDYGRLIVTMPSDAEGFDAASELFEIDMNTAFWLFDPLMYPLNLREGAAAELEVVKRIRFIASGNEIHNYNRA